MYLTRAFLNPASRVVRGDLRDPENLHKTIMRAFPSDSGPSARMTHAVLHRLDYERDERAVLLIQSMTRPETDKWPEGYVLNLSSDVDQAFSAMIENPAVRSVEAQHAAFREGDRFAFRLRANTTRKIDTRTGPDGIKRNGKRVPLRGDEARLAWLERKATASGFTFDLAAVRVVETAPIAGKGAKTITVAGALFDGILTVNNAEQFRTAVQKGIGPAKAYGFGLLSVRPL